MVAGASKWRARIASGATADGSRVASGRSWRSRSISASRPMRAVLARKVSGAAATLASPNAIASAAGSSASAKRASQAGNPTATSRCIATSVFGSGSGGSPARASCRKMALANPAAPRPFARLQASTASLTAA